MLFFFFSLPWQGGTRPSRWCKRSHRHMPSRFVSIFLNGDWTPGFTFIASTAHSHSLPLPLSPCSISHTVRIYTYARGWSSLLPHAEPASPVPAPATTISTAAANTEFPHPLQPGSFLLSRSSEVPRFPETACSALLSSLHSARPARRPSPSLARPGMPVQAQMQAHESYAAQCEPTEEGKGKLHIAPPHLT